MKAGEQPALHSLHTQITSRDWLPRKNRSAIRPFCCLSAFAGLPCSSRLAHHSESNTKICGLTNLLYTMQRTNLTSCILSIRWSLAPTTSGVDMTLADSWLASPPFAIQDPIMVQ